MYGLPRINVEKLKDNPVVKHVDHRGVDFTFNFIVQLFEKGKINPEPETIQVELEKVGILPDDLYSKSIDDIAISFRKMAIRYIRRHILRQNLALRKQILLSYRGSFSDW